MFSESERSIFEYENWDKSKVFVDPAEALRKIKERTLGKFSQSLANINSPDPTVSSEAVDILKDAAIFAFGLKPFDPATGEGWLEYNLIALVSRFNGYLNGLKKNTKL